MTGVAKQSRKKLRFTQDKVAQKAGISRQYYASIENCKRLPSVKLAKELGILLQLDWTIFFNEEVNK